MKIFKIVSGILIIGIILVFVGVGLYTAGQENPNSSTLSAAQKTSVDTSIQQKAVDAQKRHQLLDDCINKANQQTTTALSAPSLSNATAASAASYSQSVLQIQQNQIASCQAIYSE
jgi:hypothetical protein